MPSDQFLPLKQNLNSTIGEFKKKFNDTMFEKNSNMLKEFYFNKVGGGCGLKQNFNWECSLRGDRVNRKKDAKTTSAHKQH